MAINAPLRPLAARTLTDAFGLPAHFLRPPIPLRRGLKSRHVPTDIEQATGLERLQLLGPLHDVDAFDMGPLLSTKSGTLADPTLVPAYVRGGF